MAKGIGSLDLKPRVFFRRTDFHPRLPVEPAEACLGALFPLHVPFPSVPRLPPGSVGNASRRRGGISIKVRADVRVVSSNHYDIGLAIREASCATRCGF